MSGAPDLPRVAAPRLADVVGAASRAGVLTEVRGGLRLAPGTRDRAARVDTTTATPAEVAATTVTGVAERLPVWRAADRRTPIAPGTLVAGDGTKTLVALRAVTVWRAGADAGVLRWDADAPARVMRISRAGAVTADERAARGQLDLPPGASAVVLGSDATPATVAAGWFATDPVVRLDPVTGLIPGGVLHALGVPGSAGAGATGPLPAGARIAVAATSGAAVSAVAVLFATPVDELPDGVQLTVAGSAPEGWPLVVPTPDDGTALVWPVASTSGSRGAPVQAVLDAARNASTTPNGLVLGTVTPEQFTATVAAVPAGLLTGAHRTAWLRPPELGGHAVNGDWRPVGGGGPLTVGELRLYDAVRPGLPAGDYDVRVGTRLEPGTGGVAPPAQLPTTFAQTTTWTVRVDSPRFALLPSAVQRLAPAPGTADASPLELPHAVLRRATLPWERSAGSGLPWLAVVVLTDEELSRCALTVLPTAAAAGLTVRAVPDEGDPPETEVVGVPPALVSSVFPRGTDLALLCHGRETNPDDVALATGDDDGFFAVVIANRVPPAGTRCTALLVSLEARLDDITKIAAVVQPAPPAPNPACRARRSGPATSSSPSSPGGRSERPPPAATSCRWPGVSTPACWARSPATPSVPPPSRPPDTSRCRRGRAPATRTRPGTAGRRPRSRCPTRLWTRPRGTRTR